MQHHQCEDVFEKSVLLKIIYTSNNRRVAEIQIFEKTYLIVIKDETDLKFKINDYFISDWVVR